ncbi:metalloregulator ArsR/SmtB family transcription factor [Shewanella profunda]|uniref:ArsR/SmtB family transcription factor n=1 Tax=Shewanella profunda TaxID=254793 RepID=UPI00200CFB8A|nr:metalloregulator ArsR/SmtB family transcription factor [Shewanella profunda]MCL1089144.1 metalloregulator ArsR/SmtB family transcription factor [Shewanella profunda]
MKERIKVKANIFKALGHPTRLWIVEQLADGEKCVCEFVEAVDVDFSTISKHLSVLRNAGIVDMDKRGKQIFYRLTLPCLLNSLSCIDTLLNHQIQKQIALID